MITDSDPVLNALCIDGIISSFLKTLDTPRLDPPLFGLIKHGGEIIRRN